MELVLEFNYDIENIPQTEMICVPEPKWEKAKRLLTKCKEDFTIQPYLSVPPMEFYGDQMNGEEILECIQVHDDPKYVEAFKLVFPHGFGEHQLLHLLEDDMENTEESDEEEDSEEKEDTDPCEYVILKGRHQGEQCTFKSLNGSKYCAVHIHEREEKGRKNDEDQDEKMMRRLVERHCADNISIRKGNGFTK